MGILMAMFNGDMNISQLIGWRYSKIWRIHLDLRVKRWVPVCFSFFTNPVNITNDMRWAWLKMEHTSNLVYCSIFHWDKPKNCWAWHLLVFPWGNFSDPIDPPSGHWRFFFTHHISRYSRNGKLSYNELERSTMFNGKIHYKWSFSIAMLNYQGVI